MLFKALIIQTLSTLGVLALPSSLDYFASPASGLKHGISTRGIDTQHVTPGSLATNVTRAEATCIGRCDAADTLYYSQNWAGAVLPRVSVGILGMIHCMETDK